jgi:hypothetical protein
MSVLFCNSSSTIAPGDFIMLIFTLSVFLSAFLLFQIQPMIGKFILPWFGGTPAVWSTAMLFFQVLLTGGYAYAYWLIGRGRREQQSRMHISLVALAMLLLGALAFNWTSPITPPAALKPDDVSAPVLDIFKLLLVSVGLPYFILAANGPLMQAWFARIHHGQSYARLYSLSNIGSLLGLLAYPIWIEPNLSLKNQGWMWSTGFVLFGCLAIGIALQNRRAIPQPLGQTQSEPASTTPSVRPTSALRTLWIALSATASLLLLSITNQISQEVAVIPFLWILPLTLYLLTFILTFSGERGYNRKLYLILFALSVGLLIYVLFNMGTVGIYIQIFAYCALMFSACMLCHGELYLLRPEATHLTTFYLMVSIGGALGGLFVSLIAPFIFDGYWEFIVALALSLALWLTLLRAGRNADHSAWARFMFTVFLLATISLSFVGKISGVLFADRNFFGVIRVREIVPNGSTEPAYAMSHGVTVHGLQFINPQMRVLPTTYYVRDGGAGLALLNHPRAGQGLKVGMLGLGAGTLAVYGQPGDEYRLYEINSIVVDLAEGQGGYFSFLSDSQANVTTILGDARISLERELAAGQPQNFDVLVLDTFSSDSIPVHLVTKEAFDLYLKHLAPDGIIAAHISNLHLDLKPIFWQLAQYYNLTIVSIGYPGDANGGYATDWLLLARAPALLEIPAIQAHAVNFDGYTTAIPLWTDDYSNLFQILK